MHARQAATRWRTPKACLGKQADNAMQQQCGQLIKSLITVCPVRMCAYVMPQVRVHVVVLDMRDLAAVQDLAQDLPDDFREVDILVNNAGLALGVSSVSEHDLEVSGKPRSRNKAVVYRAVVAAGGYSASAHFTSSRPIPPLLQLL